MSVSRLFVNEPWRKAAACREHPELEWFPNCYEDVRTQLAICGACPVKAPCGRAGRHEADGIWGGVRRTKNTMHLVSDE